MDDAAVRAVAALLEVAHSAFKEGLAFFPGDIPANVSAATFGVSHLAENSATGAGDSLDRKEGAVGVVPDVHAGIAAGIAVLGGDLSVGGKFTDLIPGGVELSLPVGNRDEMQVIDAALREP